MDSLIIQEIINIIIDICVIVIPFSLVIGLSNIIVRLFGDFIFNRQVRFK